MDGNITQLSTQMSYEQLHPYKGTIWLMEWPTWTTRGRQSPEMLKSAVEWSWRTHHSNSIGGKQLLGAHGCDIGNVGEDIDEGHKGDGDENGTWKVPGDNTAQCEIKWRREKLKERWN